MDYTGVYLMDKNSVLELSLFLLSYSIPLVMIASAILVSPWFNIFDNALSDLGYYGRGLSAILFNLGLSSGGLLISIVSLMYLRGILGKSLLVLMGYLLVLIAVFNESYGIVHYIVAFLFFTLMITYLLASGLRKKSVMRITCGLSVFIIWTTYLILKYFRGVAIPELLSVFLFLPSYISDYLEVYR
jgi:hypothetical membrane protein